MDRTVRKRAKSLQKAFNSKELIQNLIQAESFSSFRADYIMRKIFEYYLCSMDNKTNYTYDEFSKKYYDLWEDCFKEKVEQNYYFQAFNGCYEESFKKNGLDDISDLDPKIKEAFELLKNELGDSGMAKGGKTQDKFCSFVTTSIETLMNYAMYKNPESLWCGPLKNDATNDEIDFDIPIKIGETKSEYMMRILEDRINKKDVKDKDKILKAGKIVCEAFGNRRPRIAIIPESSIENYDANYSGSGEGTPIKELAKYENENWTRTLISGPNFSSEYGIAVQGKIKEGQYTTISIPDQFELVQIFAIQRGANIGDSISPFGEIIEKAKDNQNLPTVRKSTIIEKVTNNIKNLFEKVKTIGLDDIRERITKGVKKKRKEKLEKVNKQSIESPQKQYQDCGEIELGGTGEMHLCIDKEKNEYLFKPAVRKNTDYSEPFRAHVQVIASKLQEIISPETAVKCELAEISGKLGTMQPRVNIDEEKTSQLENYYYYNTPLDEKIIRQFMREYVVDYCLVNYDSHYKNFIVDKNGNLRGIDKEQSLKHIFNAETKGDLRMDKYNPNQVFGENPPIYGKIFKDIANGKISVTVLDEVTKGIDIISKLPKDDYLQMFNPYIESLTEDNSKKNELREEILNRFDSLSNVKKMIKECKSKQSLTYLSKVSNFLKGKINERDKNKQIDKNRGNINEK